MSDIQHMMMNHMFWLLWDWGYALALGFGAATGNILYIKLFSKEKGWKKSIVVGILCIVVTMALILCLDYIRFVHIWKDVVINGNVIS